MTELWLEGSERRHLRAGVIYFAGWKIRYLWHCDMMKILIGFGDLDLIFKVTPPFELLNLRQKKNARVQDIS